MRREERVTVQGPVNQTECHTGGGGPGPPSEVHTTPVETMKVRAMPTCTTHRDGVIGAHPRGEAGGGQPGQHVEGWSNWASRIRKCDEAGGGRPGCGGEWAAKTVNDPRNNQHNPQYANY